MKRSCTVIAFFVASVLVCASQTAPKPSQKKAASKTVPKQHAAAPSFTCPDPDAKEACKSYEELVKVKDSGLPSGGFVCFRPKVDQFFVIWFSTPDFAKHWDSNLRRMVPDDDKATLPGSGYATSYKNGIDDETLLPNMMFTGNWRASPIISDSFTADSIGDSVIDVNEKVQGMGITDLQFSVVYKFKNASNANMIYSLTIQRSTGRFSESFTQQASDSEIPVLEYKGRCIFIPQK